MAQNNAVNNTAIELTIDPGASGDSAIQFDINTTNKFKIGVDDTASDAFVISQGSALGTNNTVSISAAGEIREALNPAFLADLAVGNTRSNVTGDGTLYTIVYSGALFDQNNDFNGSTTFTAPVTGRYRLYGRCYFGGVATSHTLAFTEIVTSNRTYRSKKYDLGNVLQSNQTNYEGLIVLSDMDASDTAVVKVLMSGGAKVVDIIAVTARATFQGALVC